MRIGNRQVGEGCGDVAVYEQHTDAGAVRARATGGAVGAAAVKRHTRRAGWPGDGDGTTEGKGVVGGGKGDRVRDGEGDRVERDRVCRRAEGDIGCIDRLPQGAATICRCVAGSIVHRVGGVRHGVRLRAREGVHQGIRGRGRDSPQCSQPR